MPLYQVKTRELVYVDRYYEIEAVDPSSAETAIRKSRGNDGDLVDEQMQDTYSFNDVLAVIDCNGNKAK